MNYDNNEEVVGEFFMSCGSDIYSPSVATLIFLS